MIRPERLGHVVLKVRDLDRSRTFYTEVLGMQVMKDVPEIRAVFLANHARDHHEIALFEVGADAESPQSRQVGLAHVAFRLRSEADLEAAYRELKAKQVPVRFTVNHGISKSVYFSDPDGHELEVYSDNPVEAFAGMPNAYLGLDKLAFAGDDRSIRDMLKQMRSAA